jgi:Papain-like cysteine protease AvrRpt2
MDETFKLRSLKSENLNNMKIKCSKLMLATIFLACIFSIQSCCTPNANIGSIDVPLFPQQTDMWCWAASGQMCMTFLGATVDVSQCTQANNRFGKSDCCNAPTPDECVNGGWPEFPKYGFTANVTSDAPLTWDQIKNQIDCLKKPVAFSWHWTGGGGHMMVLTGYAVIDGENWVFINNPWEPNVGAQSSMTYDDYVSGSDHTHWNDYYDITKN